MALLRKSYALANFRSLFNPAFQLSLETENKHLLQAIPRFSALFSSSSSSTTNTTASTASSTDDTNTAQVGRLNHVAIAVPNLEEAASTFKKVLGTHVSEPQTLPEHGVRVIFVQLANTKLELLEPLGKDSPIAGYLAKNPSGAMHHICLEVPDIKVAMDHVRTNTTVRPLSAEPKIGAHGTPVFFLHPKDMNGVLTEFEEIKKY